MKNLKMWIEDCRWHYDYIRLAWDSGFSFDKQKQPNLDKSKISLIDVDKVIKERDVATVEQFLSIVIGYVLDTEHAGILDINFVKVFRMSQLAVEYLLFCKRYLDNTVVLLKKDMLKAKEEVKELKSYIQDLESNLSQTKKYNLTATFKCNKCLKVFLTEDYLNSHIKRRHNDHRPQADKTPETDQLQSEIKELKERLNATEKLLKDKTDQVEMKENKGRGQELQEVYDKFEKFKEQVENEVSTLQKEKAFYEEKYNRLFDLVIQMKNAESQMLLSQKKSDINHTSIVDEAKMENVVNVTFKDNTSEGKKCEPAHSKPKILDVLTIQDNYHGNKEDGKHAESDEEKDKGHEHEVEDKIDRKISEISSTLEYKISASLLTMQTQMESFWSKLSEIQVSNQELLKSKPVSSELREREGIEHKSAIELIELEEISMVKPKIKPRTKLSYPTGIQDDTEIPSAAEKLKTQLDHYMSHQEDIGVPLETLLDVYTPQQEDIEVLMTNPEKNNTHLDQCDGGTKKNKQKILQHTPTVIKHVQSGVQQIPKDPEESNEESIMEELFSRRSRSTDRQLSKEEKINTVQERLKDLIRAKFEDIGIAVDWQGIPKKSFETALDVIKYQTNINKKRYCSYSLVRKSIEKTLNIEGSKEKLPKQKILKAPFTATQRKLSSLMKIQCRKKTKQQLTELKPIEIINHQELYPNTTDSESDHVHGEAFPLKSTLDLLQNTDPDLQSVTSLDDKTDQTETKTNSTDLEGKKKVAFKVTPNAASRVELDEKHGKGHSLYD